MISSLFRHVIFAAAFCACLALVLKGPRSSAVAPVSSPAASGARKSRLQIAGAENSAATVPPAPPAATAEDFTDPTTPFAAADPGVVATLKTLLSSSRPDVEASALDWASRDTRAQSPAMAPLIFAKLKSGNADVRDKALANMGWILDHYHGTPAGEAALAAIQSSLKQTSDRAAQLVALQLIGGAGAGGVYVDKDAGEANPFLISNAQIRSSLVALLTNPQSSLRPQVLRLVSGSPALRSDAAIVRGIAAALQDDDLSVRNQAILLLVSVYRQQAGALRAEVKPVLASARETGDPNVQLQASRALGLPVPPPRAAAKLVSLTGEKVSMAQVPFDFNYFTAFVQPLFVKDYGGSKCIDCHTPQSNSSGRFRILAPGPGGKYTLEQSRVNFVSVLEVINRKDPMESKLLLKPLNPTTREGTIRGAHHDGGVFWQSQYDPDFEIVADWLKGAKLEDAPAKQLDFAYFEKHVEPIFSTPGPDGMACVNCHFSHAILHLESPETAAGKFSIQEVINNYQSALRVVDESAPSDSYIVRKPTSPREGVAGGLSHAGGVRWPDKKQSWQYHALISWMGIPNLAAGRGSDEQPSASAATYTPANAQTR